MFSSVLSTALFKWTSFLCLALIMMSMRSCGLQSVLTKEGIGNNEVMFDAERFSLIFSTPCFPRPFGQSLESFPTQALKSTRISSLFSLGVGLIMNGSFKAACIVWEYTLVIVAKRFDVSLRRRFIRCSLIPSGYAWSWLRIVVLIANPTPLCLASFSGFSF